MSRYFVVILVSLIAIVGGCATTPPVETSAPDPALEAAVLAAESAIAGAGKELAAAKRVGAEWQLIDPATGDAPKSLFTLLGVARSSLARGQSDEAIRIANRVREAAQLGQIQATEQANAAPSYPR